MSILHPLTWPWGMWLRPPNPGELDDHRRMGAASHAPPPPRSHVRAPAALDEETVPAVAPPVAMTVALMDQAQVDRSLISAWVGPEVR